MIGLLLLGTTSFFWILTVLSFSAGDGYLVCSLLPLAIGMTYVSARLATARSLSLDARAGAASFEYPLPNHFRVLKTGDGFVEFEHPEGGSWSYGMSEDIRAVNGVEMIESLGGRRYRMHISRSATNAACVLEAAYRFRTEPKVTTDGIVDLNSCPGYDILYQEAINDLD